MRSDVPVQGRSAQRPSERLEIGGVVEVPRKRNRLGDRSPALLSGKYDVVESLYRQGNTNAESLAEATGFSSRTIHRVLNARGLRPRREVVAVDDAQVARALMLLSEGMPGTWVCEDTGLGYETIRRLAQSAPGHQEAVREWKSTWHHILNHSKLREFHDSWAPQPRRVREVA